MFKRLFAWVLILAMIAGAATVRAAITCDQRQRACAVGVRTARFKLYVARQKKSNWCWAAAIQMILHLHGVRVRQADLVRLVYGHEGNYRATGWQIIKVLNVTATDVNGRPVRVVSQPQVPTAGAVLSDLKTGQPLLVGLRNPQFGAHAYVLTAAYFRMDQNNRIYITHVVLRDPWPTNPSRRVFPWWYFKQHLMFITRVQVLRQQAQLRTYPGRVYAAPAEALPPAGLLRAGDLDGPPGFSR
jgi:hypothetical protein